MRLRPFVFFTFVGLLASYAIYAEYTGPNATLVGSIAQDFELPDLDGNMIALSDYEDRLIFLNFWATWCPPCVKEMPDMMQLQQRFEGRPFQILAVSVDVNFDKITEFYEAYDLDFVTMLDPGRHVANRYKALKFPETFLIDANGTIREKVFGEPRGGWTSPGSIALIESLIQEHESGLIRTLSSIGD